MYQTTFSPKNVKVGRSTKKLIRTPGPLVCLLVNSVIHHITLVTRNTAEIAYLGVNPLNPFDLR